MSYVIAVKNEDGTVVKLGTAEKESDAERIARGLMLIDSIGSAKISAVNTEALLSLNEAISILLEAGLDLPNKVTAGLAKYAKSLGASQRLTLDCARMSGLPANKLAEAQAVLDEAESDARAFAEYLSPQKKH